MAQPPTPGSRPGRVRDRVQAALAPALVAGVVAAACTGGGPPPEVEAAPSSTVPPIEAPTPLPDTRGVTLAGVAGTVPAPPPLAVRGGDADLVGTVTGADGPVPDAAVLLERFVADRRAALTVRTDAEGRFRAQQVHGGRYRIRSWRAPDLALTIPELRFVRADEETTVDLVVTEHDGLTVQAVAGARAPLVGESVTVTALVTRQRVDGRGIVSAPAAAGARVTLSAGPGWQVDGRAAQAVDGSGRASWSVTCAEAGSGRLDVRSGDATVVIDTSCRAPVEEPGSPAGDPAPDTDFPLGNRFSPPFAPPLPAGSYDVVQSPGSCGISFERYVDGAWKSERRTATGTEGFVASTPFRDVRVIGDSPPCLYERVS